MSVTIPVTYHRAATYSESFRADVDAHEYADWCVENGHDSADLESLKVYMLTEYCGDLEEAEPVYEDSEFSDFDNAEYAKRLTAAAEKPRVLGLTDAELHEIAMQELRRHGQHGRPMYQVAERYDLTDEDRDRVLTLIQGARITITL